MSYGKPIQRFPTKSPLGNEEIHQGDESAVVSGFQQVSHFMHDDVFQAFPWFLGQIDIEPDAGGVGATS